jgi:biopolymer transport protein ExbD
MIEVARRKRKSVELELTPLIDVVFQLLVFFLLTTTFTLPAVPLELPAVENTQERREESMLVLSIMADGSLFVGETALPEDKLDLVVQQRIALRPEQPVLVRGDIESRYGLFMRVLDACRKAGADKVLLETNQKAPE